MGEPVNETREWPEAMVRQVEDAVRACQMGYVTFGGGKLLNAIDRIATAHGVALGQERALPMMGRQAIDELHAENTPQSLVHDMSNEMIQVAIVKYRRWLRDEHGYRLAEDEGGAR